MSHARACDPFRTTDDNTPSRLDGNRNGGINKPMHASVWATHLAFFAGDFRTRASRLRGELLRGARPPTQLRSCTRADWHCFALRHGGFVSRESATNSVRLYPFAKNIRKLRRRPFALYLCTTATTHPQIINDTNIACDEVIAVPKTISADPHRMLRAAFWQDQPCDRVYLKGAGHRKQCCRPSFPETPTRRRPSATAPAP
jgi:hypothetical protein